MSELSQLIIRLQKGFSKHASYINSIKYPELLIASLQELHALIGNEKVKDAVATQVSHLIMVKRRAMEDSSIKEDEVMLNTVLYGPPGVGKTLVGTKLAKIWYSLGYLDNSHNKRDMPTMLKDLLKEQGVSTENNNMAAIAYLIFILLIVLLVIFSTVWSFYSKVGGMWTIITIVVITVFVIIFALYINASLNYHNYDNINKNTKDTPIKDGKNNNISAGTKDIRDTRDNPKIDNGNILADDGEAVLSKFISPPDEQVIKIVTRADFVDRYVGWTDKKTNKLLEENLGKVIFVDEAYSLINGPHDEFGMEALTALNLFLSQRPKEIIVIFAGYKDLLEAGPYAVQPGLRRRFMWQFDCVGYTPEELFNIFKIQLAKKGWGLSDIEATKRIFYENYEAFPAFGGDTERAAFFSELEHSREFIGNEQRLQINMLTPRHVAKGIDKLKENNIQGSESESTNPLANMMKMFSGKKTSKPKSKPKSPIIEELSSDISNSSNRNTNSNFSGSSNFSERNVSAYSDKSEPDPEDAMMIDLVRNSVLNSMSH